MERSGQTTQDQYIGYWNSFVFPINFKIAFSISVREGIGFFYWDSVQSCRLLLL